MSSPKNDDGVGMTSMATGRSEHGQGAVEMLVAMGATIGMLLLVILVVIPRFSSGHDDKELSTSQAVYLQASATAQVRAALRTIAAREPAVVSATLERTSAPTLRRETVPPAPAVLSTSTAVPEDFIADGSGQAVVSIPIVTSSFTLLVSVERAQSPLNTWVWCFDSSFGLAPNPFDTTSDKWVAYCGKFGLFNPMTGYLDARKNILLDPSWPADAAYFFKMYCLATCVWRVRVIH